jgi:phospholipid/cholesterol/gamma-HCH transport system permease protein
MTIADQSSSPFYDVSEKYPGDIVLHLKGRMDIETSASILKEFRSAIKSSPPVSLTIDLGNVSYIDDFGALVLLELKQEMTAKKGKFDYINAQNKIKEFLTIVNFESQSDCPHPLKKYTPNFVIRFGSAAIRHLHGMRYMISFLGSAFIQLTRACLHPKSLRLNDTITFMEKTGVDAIPIVGLISFLLGLVMAFTSSIQLKQFGANIYVASLVVFAMVSELGPIMTAIIVAGRSGSAYAAVIGTMRISEEIDALFSMGFQPTLFLAVPRIIASVIVVPILTLFADIFAVAGGLVVGISMLDLTPSTYMAKTLETLTLFEVMWGFMKSLVFAFIIAWIGCLRGFETRGGAASVGNAATSAVVSSIFLIILFDSFFAIIRSYWG